MGLALAAGPAAQSPPEERSAASPEPQSVPSALTEHARVDLALIEAVVLDRRGRHVRGLPSSAFRLRVGDQAVPIVSFDEIDLTRRAKTPPTETGEGEAPPEGEESAAPERDERTPSAERPEDVAPSEEEPQAERAPAEAASPAGSATQTGAAAAADASAGPVGEARLRELVARLQGPRWFVLAFDGYNNLSPLRMGQVRRAAKKWVDANLRERDMVAVYEFNPYLSSITGFTNDKWEIRKAIDKARMFPSTSMGRDMLSQRLEQGDAIQREFLEQQLLNAAQFGGDLLRAERDQFYQNLHALADAVGGLRGTKSILLFSGGFPLTRTRETAARGGFTTRFKDMIQALEQRGIRVFTYDIGVEGFYTDASEDSNFRVDLENLGFGHEWLDVLQVGYQVDTANAHQEILFVLGNETGGRFWRGKDYASGLEAADDDLSHYYLIGYRPLEGLDEEARGRRGYQRIRLEVEGGGRRVISRQGNFPSGEEQADREREVESLRAAWGAHDVEPSEAAAARRTLELSCRPQFYPAVDGETLVVLPVRVRGDVTPVSIGGTEAALDFDIRVRASVDGAVFQEGSRNVRLNFPSDRRDLLTGGIQFREAMLLPPRTYELSVEFRLNGMNRTGEWRRTFTIPARGRDGFALTDLTLLHPAASTPVVYDVFRKADRVYGTDPPAALPDPLGDAASGRPPLYLDGGFPRSVPLLAQVQITSPPPPRPDRESPLRMDWELLPADGGQAVAPPVQYRRLQLVDEGRRLDVLVDLDLGAVEPGEYTLRLTAKDLGKGGEDVRSFPITITAP